MVAAVSVIASATVPPSSGAASAASASAAPAATDGGQHLVGELDEARVLGDEVGLAVELDEHAGLAGRVVGHVRGDQAVGGGASLALGDALEALDPQDLDALSTSPSASSSAFLTSIMPAPVRSRSALMSAAV